MDILNWLYLVKNKFTRTTIENPATDLIILGADVSYQKRGDKYQNYVMTVDDFLAQSRPYKVYTALLTQTGTDAPVATVLENTLGDIVWTRENPGNYYATLNNAFTLNKTWGVVTSRFSDDGGASPYDAFLSTASSINFIILNTFNNGGAYSDNLISPSSPLSIEIRVYN